MAIEFRTAMAFEYGVPRELLPGVVRLVAPNPSAFTFKGTNTYLIGARELAVIDPGPDLLAHRAAILAAAGDRPIRHILVTHTHRDHVEGLAALKAATGAITVGYGPYTVRSRVVAEAAGGEDGQDAKGTWSPDRRLADGERIAGTDWAVTAVHTPGHLPDHLCFALEGTGVLFSGDHVMGWNTSIVAPPDGHMGDYNRSLEKLQARSEDTVYCPGHGGRIEQPQRFVKAYLMHRRMREQAIFDAVAAGAATLDAVVAKVYAGLDPKLIPAAALSALAHVEHLEERGLLRPSHPLTRASALAVA
jgi:glyoxylase-like metal-dependent hydrolase (beta-lactamase superfamily II)